MTTQSIQNLLAQSYSIHKKYKQIEKLTGENFNIFSILRKSQDELAHSRFIGNLLNSKGSHGQGSLYLELFIDIIQQKFDDHTGNSQALNSINELDLKSSRCIDEKWLGKIDSENETGGSIDLLITDGEYSFLIENKIWAEDQDKQLVRYSNAYSNAPIFYLTLFDSNEVSDISKGSLIEKKDFFKISYETDILAWIQKCIEKSASKPIVRESLRQYEFLIKKNTQQSKSKDMNEELKNLVLSNKENLKAFESLVRIEKEIKSNFFSQFIETLEKKYNSVKDYKDFDFIKDFSKNRGRFFLRNTFMKKNDLKINFTFDPKKTSLTYGITKKDYNSNSEPYKSIIESKNKSGSKSDKDWLFSYQSNYVNWDDLSHLNKYEFDKDYKDQVINYFINKIDEMIGVVKEVENKMNILK